MARIKAGPQGLYYDEQDNGPDQGTPDEIAAFKAKQNGTTAPTTPVAPTNTEKPEDTPGVLERHLMGVPTGASNAVPTGSTSNTSPANPVVNAWSTVVNPTAAITSALNNPTNPTSPIVTPPPAGQPGFGDPRLGIQAAYQVSLKRLPSEAEIARWIGNPNYVAEIAASPEAQATAAGRTFTPTYAAVEGADMNKLNDPTHNSPKYVALRILASGGSIESAAQAIGATVLSPTTMRLATGEIIDTRRDEEGANALQWTVVNDPNANANTAAAGATTRTGATTGPAFTGAPIAPTTPGSPSGAVTPLVAGSPYTSGITDNSSNELFNLLMTRAQQGTDVSANDPNVRRQSDAFAASTERARRNFLGDFAERSSPYATGAMLGQERMTAEHAGQANGAFEAQAMQQELTARRNEIQQALSGAVGFLSAQQQLKLTKELNSIDQAIRMAQLGQNAYEFDINDEFRRSPLAS